MTKSKARSQLTKNIASLTIVQIATYVLPLISVPIVSRIIGPEKFGVINFAAAYITYFTLIISYTFDFSATRRLSKDPDNINNRNLIFSEVFYTQCFLFTISTLVFVILLFNVPELRENRKILLFSYILCFSNLFTQNWLFQAMQDLSKVALFNLISRLLFTILILIAVRKNNDYIWQPLLIGITQTIVAILSFIWAFKSYQLQFLKVSLMRCFQILWEERVLFLSLVFVNFYTSTNTVILGLYQSAEQVGYYSAAQRLISIAQSVLTMPLAQAFYPFIGKAFGESKEKGLEVVQRLVPIILIYIGVASIFLFILGPLIIRAFYGSRFEATIPVFQLLTAVPLLFALNNLLGVQIMLNLNMDKYFFRVTAGAGILSILLNLVIVKKWGYFGTGVNCLVTEIFIFVATYVILRHQGLNPVKVKYFKPELLKEYLNPIINIFNTARS